MKRTLAKGFYGVALTMFSCVRADIVIPAGAPECVRWAADEVRAAVRSAGGDPRSAGVRVEFASPLEISESAEQSFSLKRIPGGIAIVAGGVHGAMYGLEELAEQIGRGDRKAGGAAGWDAVCAGVRETTQHPAVLLRGDNLFIHVYPLQLNDLGFWRAYIDELARNRFNLLDLHGAYDLASTSFPNLYPMLIHVPEYPNIGNEQAQAKNLADFREIIRYAGNRGLRVAFMNYSANDGRGGLEKNAPSVTGVPPEKLADYTAKAVTRLIAALPELSELGFRVGESGRNADFYQQSYIKGIEDAHRPDLRLYTRSWQTTQAQLEPIARAARAGFDIEVKYNGEHLGLPYQALQGSRFGSYSYQGYLGVPSDYRIIWQVRANGTHRFWAWENTDFIRRAVGTFSLGNALGFTLEPPIAYFTTDPAEVYRSARDKAVYRWVWQKHWMWYYAWGRLSYDPHLSNDRLVDAYARHYAAAGPPAYRALQRASEIVPLAFAYRFVGPDQRDVSPETETGNALGKKMKNVPALLQFIDHPPMDEESFQSIADYVDSQLAGRPDGRVGPIAVAKRLAAAAAAARAAVAEADRQDLEARPASEWRLLRTDVLSASWFGDYYARRIAALTHLAVALRTGNREEGRRAIKGLAQSREAWAKLAETADAVYAPLSNPLRRQVHFTWGGESAGLEKIDATVETLLKAPIAHPESAGDIETSGRIDYDARAEEIGAGDRSSATDPTMAVNLTARTDPSGGSATIVCDVAISPGAAPVVAVNLCYKALPSELAWIHAPMAGGSGPPGRFERTIPLTKAGLMYLVEVVTSDGRARNFPDVFRETPYRIVNPY